MTSGSLGNNAKGATRGDPFSKHVLVGAAEERAVGEGRADARAGVVRVHSLRSRMLSEFCGSTVPACQQCVLVGAAEERAVGEGRADAKPPAVMSDELGFAAV